VRGPVHGKALSAISHLELPSLVLWKAGKTAQAALVILSVEFQCNIGLCEKRVSAEPLGLRGPECDPRTNGHLEDARAAFGVLRGSGDTGNVLERPTVVFVFVLSTKGFLTSAEHKPSSIILAGGGL
jgi:hypothetical protein